MASEITNPTLADLEFLIGDWDMAISGAAFLPTPETVVHGRIETRPIEDGRLLTMRQIVEPSGPPAATWVIGRDESRAGYTVLYADGRGVSRLYEMTLQNGQWNMRRDNPQFSQRFDATVSGNSSSIVGEWQKSTEGGTWEHDFDVSYTRL